MRFWRVLSPALATAALAAVGIAAPTETHAASDAAAGIGNACMVGTWSSGPTTFLTKFHGVIVTMQGLQNSTETDDVTGLSVTSWQHAGTARGNLFGHWVTEKVRGTVTSHLHAGIYSGYVRYTNNVPYHVVETFTYRHHTTVRHPQHLPTQRTPYTCTATNFTTPAGTAVRTSVYTATSAKR